MAFYDENRQGGVVRYGQGGQLPQAPARPNPNQNAYNLAYAAYGAPQQAYANYQQQLLNRQLGLSDANYQNQLGYLGQDRRLQQEAYGLQDQDRQLQSQDFNRQGRYLDEDLQRAFRDLNLDIADFNRLAPLYSQRDALQEQLYGLQEGQINESANRQQRAQISNATARGALGSVGFGTAMNDISEDKAGALEALGINRSQYGLNAKERQAQLESDAQRFRLRGDDTYKNYNRNVENLNAAIERFNQQTKQLGLSRREAESRIDRAIEQLGISNLANREEILAAMFQTDMAAMQRIPMDVLNAVRQLSGIPGVG